MEMSICKFYGMLTYGGLTFRIVPITEGIPMAFDVSKVDLSKIADQLHKYEFRWIVISQDNEIVSSGETYAEALKGVQNPDEVVMFKVPSLDHALAP